MVSLTSGGGEGPKLSFEYIYFPGREGGPAPGSTGAALAATHAGPGPLRLGDDRDPGLQGAQAGATAPPPVPPRHDVAHCG